MRRLLLAAAIGLLAASAGADDPGGEGFAVPAGPPFDAVRDRVLVQVRPEGAPLAPGVLAREDLLGTRTVLVLAGGGEGGEDHDVTAEEAAGWGQSAAALFDLGLRNLERRHPPLRRRTPELKRGVRVNLLYGEHPFAAAYALSVGRDGTCMGNKGSLVAVPNQHATLCYPIESSRAFHGYLAMVNMAVDIRLHGENPLVPHVYWLHDGAFEAQPVRIEGKKMKPERTEGFEALLKKLPRDIHDPQGRRW